MVEQWNIGFPKDINHFNFSVNPAGCGTINPTLYYPRTHYSTIPEFQHSNWGEAPYRFCRFYAASLTAQITRFRLTICTVSAEVVEITRNMFYKFYPGFNPYTPLWPAQTQSI